MNLFPRFLLLLLFLCPNLLIFLLLLLNEPLSFLLFLLLLFDKLLVLLDLGLRDLKGPEVGLADFLLVMSDFGNILVDVHKLSLNLRLLLLE